MPIDPNDAVTNPRGGPRTEAGKAVSSHNSLKHGLTAETVLLPGEDEAAYQKLCTDTFENWKPVKEQEKALIQLRKPTTSSSPAAPTANS